MSRDDLVEVPEYALGEERIAFGLTAPQLAILVGAGLLAAALNLLPLWAPVKLGLIVLAAGPAALTAVLQIRGEPAYRWLLRAVRYWRAPKVWRPVVIDEAASSKRPGSGDGEAGVTEPASLSPLRGVTASGDLEGGGVASGVDNGRPAAVPAAPSPPDAPPAIEEQGDMDGKLIQLHPREPDLSEEDSDTASRGEQRSSSPPLPYVFPFPRIACLISFAGGVGKTTLAVELATYLAAHGRYRGADGEAHDLDVLLIDAARMAPAVGLRLGLSPRALSEAWRWVDRRDAGAVAATIRPVGDHLSLLTLAPDPSHLVAEPSSPPEAEFSPDAAMAVIEAAGRAGSVLAIVDLGGPRFEAGHVRLIEEAELVIGVVRPTVESLPDLYRLGEWLRRAGAGRKLAFAANQCDDDAEVASIAREVGAPLLGTVPTSAALARAGERGEAGWLHDPVLAASLERLAGALWPLAASAPQRHGLARLALRRLGGVLRRSG